MKPKRYGPFPYSAIIDRPKKLWPNGARIAVWVIPNIEFFALDEQIPAAAGGGGLVPDVSTWSSRDYGNRIGVYRIMEVMKRYGVRGTVALNSELTAEHPRIIEECLKLDWELMGHNESNTRRLNAVTEEESSAIVKRTVDTIFKNTGQHVKGWLSSGLSENWNSLDDLVNNGIEYVADWVNDDQPYKMTLDDGRSIMSIPYSTELNDKPAYEKKFMDPYQFEAMICRQFDVLWHEGGEQARAMGIALHPYISGVPHRIGALEGALKYMAKHQDVWFTTGSEIAQAGKTL